MALHTDTEKLVDVQEDLLHTIKAVHAHLKRSTEFAEFIDNFFGFKGKGMKNAKKEDQVPAEKPKTTYSFRLPDDFIRHLREDVRKGKI